MLVSEIEACSFSSWYPNFSEVTIPSVIHYIPNNVLEYLRSDSSLVLPLEAAEVPDSDSEDESDLIHPPSFPEFNLQIKNSIRKLGDDVFVKLNWSSPQDASWIALGNSLKCDNLSSIYLLLKSSNYIARDLREPFIHCSDFPSNELKYTLILRKWINMNSSHEFRVFVKSNQLHGICQRDTTQYISYISSEREMIIRDIENFFIEHIHNVFPLKDYVFDVYRPKEKSIILIDFNPFGPPTDPLFFDWNELDIPERDLTFKSMSQNVGIQPNTSKKYSIPLDILDLTSGLDPNKLIDFLKLQTSYQK